MTMRIALAALVAAVVALAGCGVGGGTIGGHASAVPPQHFDAGVFFCTGPPVIPPCAVSAGSEEVAQVRTALLNDPRVNVQALTYVSPEQAEQIERRRTSLPPNLLAGQLPASFVVALGSGSFEQFAAKFRRMAGVQDVVACNGQPWCSADVLRAVGALN